MQTHEEAALLEDYAEELALARDRAATDISGALFAALSEVQENVVESRVSLEELSVPSLEELSVPSPDGEACESLVLELSPPLEKPKKTVRFAEILEQVRFIDARIIVPSGNKYPLRKTIPKPPVRQSPTASPPKVPRAGGINASPIGKPTRIPQRKENIPPVKIATTKSAIPQRRPSVQKTKVSTATTPSPKTSSPTKRISPPSTPPSKGTRKSFSASRGFLP